MRDSNTLRLILGDCLERLKTIPDDSVDAVITDPPYGMDFQSNMRVKSEKFSKIANDKRPYIWFLPEAFRVLKPGGAMFCFTDWANAEAFRFGMELAGFAVRSQGVWDRQVHGMGDLKAQLAPSHDIIWFATKGKFAFPGKRPKSVYACQRISGACLVHPNQKPIDLMEQLVASLTVPGQLVLDPFMGSGSTGVAAMNTGRSFIGIEKSSEYFKIAEDRIVAATPPCSLDDCYGDLGLPDDVPQLFHGEPPLPPMNHPVAV